jgi:hypothetical protein
VPEIGTEAVQFPEKEYINGIFVAVHSQEYWMPPLFTYSTVYEERMLRRSSTLTSDGEAIVHAVKRQK